MTYLEKDEPQSIDNSGISDLWFNWDHSDSKLYKDGVFVGWDFENMSTDAESFMHAINSSGLVADYTAEELIDDFLARV